jgi:hypothetical protein
MTFGRFRLHVEHVELTRPAELIKKDYALGACLRRIGASLLFGREQFGHGEAQEPKSADLQKAAAR